MIPKTGETWKFWNTGCPITTIKIGEGGAYPKTMYRERIDTDELTLGDYIIRITDDDKIAVFMKGMGWMSNTPQHRFIKLLIREVLHARL